MYPSHSYFLYAPRVRDDVEKFPPDPIQVRTPQSLFDRKFRSYWRTAKISGLIRGDRLDIYHGLSNELPLKISGTGVHSVVTIHDLIFIRFPELYHRIDRNIYRLKLNYAVRSAEMIIAISEQTKRDIVEFTGTAPEKISVVYQSCNPAFGIDLSLPDKRDVLKKYGLPENYILYVGTIEKRKNLLSIVEALHDYPIDIPLIVIGREKEYAAEVRSYIEKHRMKNITFLKNVPSSDLPAIYQQAMLFVYPSSFEGFGIPVLEAISSGVPVIAGRGSCLEETGGPASVYVDPLDTENLGYEIDRIAGDENLRLKMTEAGRQFAKQFSEEMTTEKLNRIYESLI